MTRDAFVQAILTKVRQLLTALERTSDVHEEMSLFTEGHLTSTSFVDLLAFVETDLGVVIPDDKLDARYFQTRNLIADHFWQAP